ncbi:XkdW family protein [Paenibacillus thiaminolyticus]|uniref:XkdW family protein n=1 Tax=Paenibacillus thiaminolyticus TaxID=49283 RepID=UPI002350D1A3|nr:XkdW family protein [Paenibacillus thiaminolyticus]WCR27030.1 XkdW family protein [Paenibacillus thiaminolyticus]
MKTAIITDLYGRFIEPTLVADSVTGVFDRREPVEPKDVQPKALKKGDQRAEPEPVLVGYTVAVQMPDGLYQPIFDVEGYREAQEAYNAGYADYLAAMAEYDPDSDIAHPEPPLPVDGPSFWRNGLTDEEIEALNPPSEPSQTDVLGQELTQMKIKNIQQQSVIDNLGAELAKAKLELIKLKGGQSA